ncbi:hypothetical protein QBC37DRAFT_428052 [Rhypophila decipiens]|uniref:Uncharacterized protein n=1 Tax=Rhypophila decipiens TaxID=261697 RepID=A0AAN6Y3V3_9PEZI|nr:hypothetical protein QBC37DRAFT_428052 [Rhypophila decipiens]
MKVFGPTCTFPSEAPSGFVDDANLRSTMDVVWSCLSIIFLSTWSVLHMTLPPDITTRTTIQELRKQIYLLGRKMGWMVFRCQPTALLGPPRQLSSSPNPRGR